MFLFDFNDENNPQISYLAFEQYAIYALKKYLANQNKPIELNRKYGFDAYLPQGIDDLNEPVNIEIKYFREESKNKYFDSLSHLIDKINRMNENVLILILGVDFSNKSIQSMMNKINKYTKKTVYIWTLSIFQEKTKDFRNINFEDIKNHNALLIDAAINNDLQKNDFNIEQEIRIETLKSKYKNEEIVLFLGAGVSIASGIPLWSTSTLVNKLHAEMISDRLKDEEISADNLNKLISLAYENQDASSIAQMRYIKNAFEETKYQKLVHNALYSGGDTINTSLLEAISLLCRPSRNHLGVQGIVTYNFDDLLERRLAKDNIETNPIFDELGHSTSDKLSIFHVHGFLPKALKKETPVELVFSEEDYHKIYKDAYCWSNIIQLNYLREKVCLFIGCSLTDPNLRRLLDGANRGKEAPRHYAIMQRPQISKADEISARDIELYQKIDINIKETCFASMGINVIWIDDFKEIPTILKRIKE